ncbi:hypothetical protein [Saccharothrix sp. HUAS TT1]|uniref:hypothetical protein n=1 Tax=unclassified Saccharothrix TaxID=2593673 RepID=UPI00345B9E22
MDDGDVISTAGILSGVDGALRDLARNTDLATAAWTARVLEHPADHLALDGPAWP